MEGSTTKFEFQSLCINNTYLLPLGHGSKIYGIMSIKCLKLKQHCYMYAHHTIPSVWKLFMTCVSKVFLDHGVPNYRVSSASQL